MCRWVIGWFSFFAVYLACGNTAFAGSFDCSKAALPTDYVVCSTPQLLSANDAVAAAWSAARDRLDEKGKAVLLADQKAWLREMAIRCGLPDRGRPNDAIITQAQNCVLRKHEERAEYLRAAARTGSLPAAQGGRAPPDTGSDIKPLFRVGTETAAPGETRPSQDLVRVVLDAIDKEDVDQLDECLSEEGLRPADYASLLNATKIIASTNVNLWFVRPAIKPYYHDLYGAHLFRYFWIEEQHSDSAHKFRLLLYNAGDFFAVYARQSHGLNDIEATGCTAQECRSERMAFDGGEYQTVQCSWMDWDDQGREITHARRCGSDDWRDDQASGLSPDK